MDYGEIIAQGTPEALIKQHSPEMPVVLPKDSVNISPDDLNLPYRNVRDRIEIKTEDVNSCLNHLLSHNIDLTDLTVRSPNLETVFLNLTGRHLRD
jgi:ABC-2 type transport system ATP-binding protein